MKTRETTLFQISNGVHIPITTRMDTVWKKALQSAGSLYYASKQASFTKAHLLLKEPLVYTRATYHNAAMGPEKPQAKCIGHLFNPFSCTKHTAVSPAMNPKHRIYARPLLLLHVHQRRGHKHLLDALLRNLPPYNIAGIRLKSHFGRIHAAEAPHPRPNLTMACHPSDTLRQP